MIHQDLDCLTREHLLGAQVIHGVGVRGRVLGGHVVVHAVVPLVPRRLVQQRAQSPGGQHHCGGQVHLQNKMVIEIMLIKSIHHLPEVSP